MKSFKAILLVLTMLVSMVVEGQSFYIINIDGNEVMLDATSNQVKANDQLEVFSEGNVITHPVTGEKIKTRPKSIGRLVIKEAYEEYSLATPYPEGLINQLEVGMQVTLFSKEEQLLNPIQKALAVQPITVIGSQGTQIGDYMADILSQNLYKNGDFRIIDRTTLNFQLNEQDLGASGYIPSSQAAQLGKTAGIDYLIAGTVDVEVRETGSNVPLKSILSGIEIVSGQNLGSDFISNAEIKKLTAISRITLKVIDIETGEVKFICTEEQKVSGKSNIALEGGLLGGARINNGAAQFLKTVSGQASSKALSNASNYLTQYFNGSIKEKFYEGNKIVDFKSKESSQPDADILRVTKLEVLSSDSSYVEIPVGADQRIKGHGKPKEGDIVHAYYYAVDTSEITNKTEVTDEKVYAGPVEITKVAHDASSGIILDSNTTLTRINEMFIENRPPRYRSLDLNTSLVSSGPYASDYAFFNSISIAFNSQLSKRIFGSIGLEYLRTPSIEAYLYNFRSLDDYRYAPVFSQLHYGINILAVDLNMKVYLGHRKAFYLKPRVLMNLYSSPYVSDNSVNFQDESGEITAPQKISINDKIDGLPLLSPSLGLGYEIPYKGNAFFFELNSTFVSFNGINVLLVARPLNIYSQEIFYYDFYHFITFGYRFGLN